MPFERKSGTGPSKVLTGTIPGLPNFPRGTIQRFAELEQYDQEMQRWWSRFGELAQRDRETLQSRLLEDERSTQESLSAANALITTLQEQVATLQTQVAALQAGGGTEAAQIAELQADFDAHIQAKAAHGTTGDIVGTTDTQTLERKTIGQTFPGYGRFAPTVGYRKIDHGRSVTIGPDDFMIVAGSFVVDGTLVVEGTLIAL